MPKINKIKKFRYLSYFTCLLLFVVAVCLAVGYSTFQASFDINKISAFVRAQKDIRITGFSVDSFTSSASAFDNLFSSTNVFSSIYLPNSNSTVTFDVMVTNVGNVEMGITDIVGLPADLDYDIVGYTLGSTLCDSNDSSQCKLGSVTRFQITIGYAENAYSSGSGYNLDLAFEFDEITYVARIGNTRYQTLKAAAMAVPANGVQTTIVLLKNTAERVAFTSGKNVVLDFANLVISNDGAAPVFEIQGSTVRMSNGTITSNATQGAVNIESNGIFIMSGGSIIATGNRQAIYVDTGSVEISGTAYLSASALVEANKPRGTVQTLATGFATITGGTIISNATNGIALSNAGTSMVGVKDGTVSTTRPSFIGSGYGAYITGGTFKYYDGVFKGAITAINDETLVNEVETSYEIVHTDERIDGVVYDSAILGHGVTVTFDPGLGSVDNPTKTVIVGTAVGTLPVATRPDYTFDGWYTSNDRLIDSSEIINGTTIFYAHWTHIDNTYIAMIGNTQYRTLAAAIEAVTTSTPTTITLIRNTTENVTVASNRNITFDFQSYTVTNSTSGAVIEVSGNVTMISGTITSNSANTSAINVKDSGSFTITGGSIIATGKRQAIYNEGGNTTISGNPYLSSKAEYASDKKRGTVQNLSSKNRTGVMTITGGTIESFATNGIGVSNTANLTIGVNDGVISTTQPNVRGNGTGLYNSGTLNLYDGIFKGQSAAVSGSISLNQGFSFVTTSETINGLQYEVKYLQ